MIHKKPDAILQAHEPESFLKTVLQLGFKGKVLFASHVYELLADTQSLVPELKGIYVVEPAVAPEFVARFEKRFSRPPILEAYTGYEGLRSIVKAIEANPNAPAKAFAALSYDGVAGAIDFTKGGCAGNWAKWSLRRFERELKAELIKN
jgi:hypothetical protein